jgi:hypothetical protein
MEPEDSLPCSQEPPLVPILSQINPVHTIPSYPISLRSTLILFTHPRRGLHSGLFPSGFPSKTLYKYNLYNYNNKHPAPTITGLQHTIDVGCLDNLQLDLI